MVRRLHSPCQGPCQSLRRYTWLFCQLVVRPLTVNMNISFPGSGAREKLLHHMMQFAASRICYIQGSNLDSSLGCSCAVIPSDIDLRLSAMAEHVLLAPGQPLFGIVQSLIRGLDHQTFLLVLNCEPSQVHLSLSRLTPIHVPDVYLRPPPCPTESFSYTAKILVNILGLWRPSSHFAYGCLVARLRS